MELRPPANSRAQGLPGSTTSACGARTWIDREQNPYGEMVSFPTARTRQS